METTFATPSTVSKFASLMGTSGTNPMVNVFRPKSTGEAAADATSTGNLSKGVSSAIQAADQLVKNYATLKVEILDRSDRALWEMIQSVYQFVEQIDRSPTKRDTRNELLRKIQLRDSQSMATNASTEAIAVRYVFADQSRQSRNNYTIAMEKARALGIGADSFADFLTENGGVGNVVEAVFDFEEEDMATAKELSEAAKTEKKSRTELVTRLLAAMAHTADSLLNYKGEVSNWVPDKPKSTSKIKEKHEPKFEKGNFVFFVTVHNPETGNYHVVQGNQFDQAYEQQLLASIADRMAVDTTELSHAVQGLEKSLGFGASTAASKEVATA